MNAPVSKITLNTAQNIPFNLLILSQSNVRRLKAGQSIEELAEDIARRSLLQSLSVRPIINADGSETGMYEVPAGGRRYRALELLIKQKRLSKSAPVPCVIRLHDANTSAEEDSLAENVQRISLHPLDQFRAFQTFREQGASEEDIAARFFVGVNVVKQRLRLAHISPVLLEAYANEAMSLDQLMAFSVSTDHARQEQVWAAIKTSWSKEPYQIRRQLTESTVQANDKRAQFVGLDAYEAAGGVILRDLFQGDDGGWLQDPALLDEMVTAKLKSMAAELATEGWKWVEAVTDLPYGHTRLLRPLSGLQAPLSDEAEAARASLAAEYDAFLVEYEGADEFPEAIDQRLSALEAAIAEINDRPIIYDPQDIKRAGAFLSLAQDGSPKIERGYVRAEDEPGLDTDGQGADAPLSGDGGGALLPTTIVIGGQVETETGDEDEVMKPLPERLIAELMAYRTLALQDAVAAHPHIALTALLHKLVSDCFSISSGQGCLQASLHQVSLGNPSPGLKDSASAKSISARHQSWSEILPRDDQALWDWLNDQGSEVRGQLLAHCVSFGVNALVERTDPYGSGLSQHSLERRLSQANRLAQVVDLDMVAVGWRPTVENYLGRVTKPRILEAVREAKGENFVGMLDHLKKADMAKEAERLLEGTGWLPEVLSMPMDSRAEAGEPDTESAVDVPDFLTANDDEVELASPDHMSAAAAE